MKIQAINNSLCKIQTFKGSEEKPKNTKEQIVSKNLCRAYFGFQAFFNPDIRTLITDARKKALTISNNAIGITNRSKLHMDAVPKCIISSGDSHLEYANAKAEMMKEIAKIAQINNYEPLALAGGKMYKFERKQDGSLYILETAGERTISETRLCSDGTIELGKINSYDKDAVDIYTLNTDGSAELQIGLVQTQDGLEFTSELYGYEDGKPVSFTKNLLMKDLSDYSQQEHFEFENGKVAAKIEDFKLSEGIATSKRLFLHDETGNLKEYVDSMLVDEKEFERFDFSYLFNGENSFIYYDGTQNMVIKDGKLQSYTKFKPYAKEKNTVDYIISFDDGKFAGIKFANQKNLQNTGF